MRYKITHSTSYSYDAEVEGCYERACLRPRDTGTQQVLEFSITASPAVGYVETHTDVYGNYSTYLELPGGTQQIEVVSTSVVDVWGAGDDPLTATVAQAAALSDRLDPRELADFTSQSRLVRFSGGLRAYSAPVLAPDRPLAEALEELLANIHRDFDYRKGVTGVGTSVEQVLSCKEGVCQDFAHLFVGACRMAGLAARYVSGYLETDPPPGRAKLRGADATHAWASVWTGERWLDLDPTNNKNADERHITLAWGRDFDDVSPLRGIVMTEAKHSQLKVAVDVEAV
ncbi:MAG: transglutaminase family protein [Propionibacteriaceae bacterium]|nr:transglutaminase family protein [Propionibacteriaceae bacterium]